MRSSFPILLCVFLAVGCGKPAEPQTPTPPGESTDPVSVAVSEKIWLEDRISLELTDIYPELVSNPAIQYKYTLGTRGDYVFRVGELSLHHTFDIDPHQFFIPAWKAVKATELPIIEEEIDDGLIRFGANGFDNFRFPDFHMPEGATFRHARASGAARVHLSFNEDFPIDTLSVYYFYIRTGGLTYYVDAVFQHYGGSVNEILVNPDSSFELTREGLDFVVTFNNIVISEDDPYPWKLYFEKDGDRLDLVSDMEYSVSVCFDKSKLSPGMEVKDLPPLEFSVSLDVDKIVFTHINADINKSFSPDTVTLTGTVPPWPEFLKTEGTDIVFDQPYFILRSKRAPAFIMPWDYEAFTDCGTANKVSLDSRWDWERECYDDNSASHAPWAFDRLFRTPLPETFGFNFLPLPADQMLWEEGQNMDMSFSAEWFVPFSITGDISSPPVNTKPFYLSGKTLSVGKGNHKLHFNVETSLPFSCEVVPELSLNGGDPIELSEFKTKVSRGGLKTFEIPFSTDTDDWTLEVYLQVTPKEISAPFRNSSIDIKDIAVFTNTQ